MALVSLLICPGCRTLRDGRLDLRALEQAGDELRCDCGRRYPILDGVPLVVADAGGLVRGEGLALVERDLPPAIAALLVEHTPDDAPYARLLEHVSIYLDAHWGDRADPPVELALDAVLARLAALDRVEHACELGCSAGRIVAALAARADHVVGLDLQLATVRRARRLFAGQPVAFARKQLGRHYAPAGIPGQPLENVTLLCADALDPPLIPRSFDRVVALNLLDSVTNPRQLLSVIDGLCEVGGEIVLGCPWSWQSSVVPDHHRFGGADPGAALRALLVGGELTARYEIVEQADLPWSLRRDARSTLTYRIEYLRARKL